MSLSISRGSPVTTSTNAFGDGQFGFGVPQLAYLTDAGHLGHLFPFPSSPTYWVTRSVVIEATAHITVRLCHSIPKFFLLDFRFGL
jgi:hypothetical protein